MQSGILWILSGTSLRHPYECDANGASEESDLVVVRLQDSSPWSRPCGDRAPEGLDGTARPRIRVGEIGREDAEKAINGRANSETYTPTSFLRTMDERYPRGNRVLTPLCQDSSMPDARIERRLYMIAILVLICSTKSETL